MELSDTDKLDTGLSRFGHTLNSNLSLNFIFHRVSWPETVLYWSFSALQQVHGAQSDGLWFTGVSADSTGFVLPWFLRCYLCDDWRLPNTLQMHSDEEPMLLLVNMTEWLYAHRPQDETLRKTLK